MIRNLCVVLFLVVSAVAQVPVSTRLIDGQGHPLPQAYLQFELKNCGNNFPVFSPTPALAVDRKFALRPNSQGIVSGQLLPTDQILCGNIASTAWTVQPMRDAATPLQPAQTYRVLSTEFSSLIPFDPTVALPLSGPLPAPGFQTVFANPTKSQTIIQPTGTSLIFKGVYDFTQATVLGLSGGGGGGGGGIGDALLNFPTDQTFQGLEGRHQFFDCPPNSTGGFVCFQFRTSNLANILSIAADGTITWGNGIDGTMRLSRIVQSVGTVAATGFVGLTSTALGPCWKANLSSGDNCIGQDNNDQLIFSGFQHFLDSPAGRYLTRNTTLTACQPITAQSVDVVGSSPWMVDAACQAYQDPGGDSCATLKTAETAAIALGNIDVYAGGLTGDRRCATNPTNDSYQGTVWTGNQSWWLVSNAAMWTSHARLHIKGREGRSASGSISGTIIALCNNDNTACNGSTYNPTANNLCVDGASTTVPCPAFTWSLAAEHGNPSQQMFASTLEDVTINCNSIAGAIGIRNGMFPLRGTDVTQVPACNGKCGAQENSWVKGVRLENCGNAGTGIQMLPGSSNFQVESMNILNEQQTIADCSAFHAVDILFDSSVVANGPKRVENITNTNSACTIKPVDSALLDAGEVVMKGYHNENATGSGIKVGSRANVLGATLINVNGVGSNSTSAVIRISSGNTVGLTAINTVNVNPAGYTIKDEYHGMEVRIDCQDDTAFYAFGAGIADKVVSDAPCIPAVLTMGPPFITNVALSAGDVLKYAGGSTTYQVTKTGDTTATQKPLGITLAAIADTAIRVPVATFGIVGVGGIPGPILDTAMADCHIGDYVYYGPTTNGKVKCSATRPANMGILGVALNTVTAGNTVPMLLNPEEPGQPFLTQCTGTGTAASPSVLACTTNNVGSIKCAHASSGGLCEIQFTAGTVLKSTSQITLTGDTTITTGCDPLTAALYVSLRSFAPASACGDNTKDCIQFPVQVLGGTNGLCVGYALTNITP